MKRFAVALIFLAGMFGCTKTPPASAPVTPQKPVPTQQTAQPATNPVKITGVQKMNFPDGDSALVLNYETEVRIEDKQSLTAEANAIWVDFQKEVEKAQVNTGILRATHNETSFGIFSTGSGYGFIFKKDANGEWALQDEAKP